jgi:topoisomerase-4 subunit A
VAVWHKNDERTTYNLAYIDGATGRVLVKRFNITAITRDKEYPVGGSGKGSKVLYLTANPNGESEIITVTLSAGSTAKIKVFDYDFGEMAIKGRDAQGNILTKYPIRQIKQKEAGKSTIGARKFWFDTITGRLNIQERGDLLGEFDTGDHIIILYHDGSYEVTDTDVNQRFEMKEILHLCRLSPDLVINAVHFDGLKGWTMVKRFKIETNKIKERFSYLTEHPKSKLLFATVAENPRIKYTIKLKGKPMTGELTLGDFMDPKGWKAVGNKLSDQLLTGIKEIPNPVVEAAKPAEPEVHEAQQPTLFGEMEPVTPKKAEPKKHDTPKKEEPKQPEGKTFKPGDMIEFD